MDILAIDVVLNRRMGDKDIDSSNVYFLYFDKKSDDYLGYMQSIKWDFKLYYLADIIHKDINLNASRCVLDYCIGKELSLNDFNCLPLTLSDWAYLWRLNANPLEIVLALKEKTKLSILFSKTTPKIKHVEISVDVNITSTITEYDD